MRATYTLGMRTLIKKLIPRKVFKQIEPYGHLGEAILTNVRYGFPARGLKVIGVTGTDGKTSTCTLITQMMRNSGYKVAMTGWGQDEDRRRAFESGFDQHLTKPVAADALEALVNGLSSEKLSVRPRSKRVSGTSWRNSDSALLMPCAVSSRKVPRTVVVLVSNRSTPPQ